MLEKILEEIIEQLKAEGCIIDNDAGNRAEEIIRKHMNDGWISCEERLPECEEEVYILTERGTRTTAIYEDGTMSDDVSMWNWTDIDFDYDEESDTNFIPEGWWEYRHFNPDDVYNNAVDEKVIAWQPLPEPYRPEKGEETC